MPARAVTRELSNSGGINNIKYVSKSNETGAAGMPATIGPPSVAGASSKNQGRKKAAKSR
jgi:hypothetical protein